jgi:hypothetical protein
MRHTRNPDGRQQPLLKHAQHPVVIRRAPKMPGQCYYYCTKCKVWVSWLSKKDSAQAMKMELVK